MKSLVRCSTLTQDLRVNYCAQFEHNQILKKLQKRTSLWNRVLFKPFCWTNNCTKLGRTTQIYFLPWPSIFSTTCTSSWASLPLGDKEYHLDFWVHSLDETLQAFQFRVGSCSILPHWKFSSLSQQSHLWSKSANERRQVQSRRPLTNLLFVHIDFRLNWCINSKLQSSLKRAQIFPEL